MISESYSSIFRSLFFLLCISVHLYVFLLYSFKAVPSLHRALQREVDDLSVKAREAEKEVNMLQMKIEEVNHNLTKYHKDMDCKIHICACLI